MVEVPIANPFTALPGAEDPNALAISFGEGATDACLRLLGEMGNTGWAVQVSTPSGSRSGLAFGYDTTNDGLYALRFVEAPDDEFGAPDFDAIEPEPTYHELVPLADVRRIHIW